MEVWCRQNFTDNTSYRPSLGLDRNLVRLKDIAGHFDQNQGNSFVFTCKFGWIDMFHFWQAARFAYISNSLFLTVEGGGAIEGLQTVGEFVYNNVAPLLGKDTVEPSAWSPEDLQSNLLGAHFGLAAIGHDAPVVRRYLSNRRSKGALFGGTTNLPLSKDMLYNLAGGWQRFLREAGAPSWRRYSGALHNAVWEDLQEYKRTRPKVFTIFGADAYKKKSKVYKCVCDGNQPKPPYRMSGYFLPK